MSVENVYVTDVVAALTVFQKANWAYFDSREELTHALGTLVGKYVDISGFPTSKIIASSVDEKGAVLRRNSVPAYRQLFTDEAGPVTRQLVDAKEHFVVSMGPSGLNVAKQPIEAPKQQFELLGYIFQLQGIESLRIIEKTN